MFLQQPFPSDEEGLPDSEVAQKILKHLTKDKIFNKRYAWLLDNELDWPKLWMAKGGGFKAYCDGLRKHKGHVNNEVKKKMAFKSIIEDQIQKTLAKRGIAIRKIWPSEVKFGKSEWDFGMLFAAVMD